MGVRLDKALGPGSLSLLFFRTFWLEVKTDLIWLMDEVFRGRARLNRINYFLITLMPKKTSSECIGDYTPIALLNNMLKIVSRILVNRLTPKL